MVGIWASSLALEEPTMLAGTDHRFRGTASAVFAIGLALAFGGVWVGCSADHAAGTHHAATSPGAASTSVTSADRSGAPTARAAGAEAAAAPLGEEATPTTGSSAGSDRLLYAVSSGTAGRWPHPTRTEIYAIDPESAASDLVFSDAGKDFVLLAPLRSGTPSILFVAAGTHAFAHGTTRQKMAGGYAPDAGSLYELSTDGSNDAREVCRVEGQQTAPRNVFVSPTADKIGYVNDLEAKWFVFIHDTETGARLSRIPVEPILLDGFVRNIGFMPDGEHIFLTGETGDADMTSEESYRRVGSYVVNPDGTDVSPLPDSVDGSTTHPGYHDLPDTPPTMLAVTPDGRYLFSDMQFGQGNRGTRTFYFRADPTTGAREEIEIEPTPSSRAAFLWSKPSLDGSYLAFSEIDTDGSVETVRILDLRSGATRTALTHAATVMSYPVLTVIGWVTGVAQ